jgi:hypothetical protein
VSQPQPTLPTEVYNLRDLAQFPGTYGQARYGFAIGTAGAGDLWLQNEAGVIIPLKAQRTGLLLSLGGDAVVISMRPYARAGAVRRLRRRCLKRERDRHALGSPLPTGAPLRTWSPSSIPLSQYASGPELRWPYAPSSSSTALASWRSAVSKPSVNQR